MQRLRPSLSLAAPSARRAEAPRVDEAATGRGREEASNVRYENVAFSSHVVVAETVYYAFRAQLVQRGLLPASDLRVGWEGPTR
jgi:hypothetical protein